MDTAADRVALLVIRVWIEAGSDPPALRARVTAVEGLGAHPSEAAVAIASEIDDICDSVRVWLTHFLAAAKESGDTPPGAYLR